MQKLMQNPVQTSLLLALAAGSAINAVWMITSPETWFNSIPGVEDTGPFNAHFVKDVGAAYLAFATNLILALRYLHARFQLVLAGSLFMITHAMFHLFDQAGNLSHHSHFLAEFITVIVPGILCVAITLNLKLSTAIKGV